MFDFLRFNGEKQVEEEFNNTNDIQIDDIQRVIDDVFNSIEDIIMSHKAGAKNFLDYDVYIGNIEDLNKLFIFLKHHGLNLQKIAGLYIISRTTESDDSIVIDILRKFKYVENKN